MAHERVDRIELLPLSRQALRCLVDSGIPDLGLAQIPDGALPPAHVAARALRHLDAGMPARWCVPYVVVDADRRIALGGCTFKTAPVEGVVEVGYGVARSQRRRGVASAAVAQLLHLAAESGEVTEVIATIEPANAGSIGVVAGLGFARGERFVDTDGAEVECWRLRLDARPVRA